MSNQGQQSINSKRALSIPKAAKYAGVSDTTMRNWISSGLIPYEELPSNGKGKNSFKLIRLSDLNAFHDKHYHTPQKTFKRPQEGLKLLPKGTATLTI